MNVAYNLIVAKDLYRAGMIGRALESFQSISIDPAATEVQRETALGYIDRIKYPALWDEALFNRRIEALKLKEKGYSIMQICETLDITPSNLRKILPTSEQPDQ